MGLGNKGYRIKHCTIRTVVSLLCAVCCSGAVARAADKLDSLRSIIQRANPDTNFVKALNAYGLEVHETYPDTTRLYATRALALADSLNFPAGAAQSFNLLGIANFIQNYYEKALEYYLKALRQREHLRDLSGIAGTLNNIGMVHRDMKNHRQALQYYFQAVRLNDSLRNLRWLARNYSNIGTVFEELQQLDSALAYHQRSLALKQQIGDKPFIVSSLRSIGHVHLLRGQYQEALSYLSDAVRRPEASKQTVIQALLDIGEIYYAENKPKEAIEQADRAITLACELKSARLEQQAHEQLFRYYRQNNEHQKALEHYERSVGIRDSLYNEQSVRRLTALQTNYELERQRSQIVLLTKEQKLQGVVRNALLAGAFFLLVLLVVLVIAYKNKRRSAKQLQETNAEILRQQELLAEQAQEIELINTMVSEKNIHLEAANENLIVLNQEKNEFLGIAAHDLKNPLNAIRGLADMILMYGDEMDEGQKLEFLTSIVNSSERMFDLIKNLLDVNAMENGGIQLQPVHLDITGVVETLLDHYGQRAANKSLVIRREYHGALMVAVDEQAVAQIFDNLVSNAIKYSPPGRTITVRIQEREKVARIEVQDEGPGLTPEDRQKLFGKFARLSAQPTGGEHSTGLGLSIVKKLTEHMGGRVWCESKPGHGATFIVEFPVVVPDELRSNHHDTFITTS